MLILTLEWRGVPFFQRKYLLTSRDYDRVHNTLSLVLDIRDERWWHHLMFTGGELKYIH